jgi:hypothetical protein
MDSHTFFSPRLENVQKFPFKTKFSIINETLQIIEFYTIAFIRDIIINQP